MPDTSKTPSPENGALARQSYIDGKPVSEILGETGMSAGTLYLWIDGGPAKLWPRLAPIPRRKKLLGKRRRVLKGDRVSLVVRLWSTAERQVRDIEERLSLGQQEPADRERDARMMAVLVKTLRELTQLDANENSEAPADDDEGPRDIDEFRRDLARRMEDFVRRRTGVGFSGGGDAE